mmetsp:Transcript_37292/g.92194  ORF Transcript_37292/g.92194 Transcript_37292/m.92194 type:complete len:218 (+) Transcript_37292:627-1280(+)
MLGAPGRRGAGHGVRRLHAQRHQPGHQPQAGADQGERARIHRRVRQLSSVPVGRGGRGGGGDGRHGDGSRGYLQRRHRGLHVCGGGGSLHADARRRRQPDRRFSRACLRRCRGPHRRGCDGDGDGRGGTGGGCPVPAAEVQRCLHQDGRDGSAQERRPGLRGGCSAAGRRHPGRPHHRIHQVGGIPADGRPARACGGRRRQVRRQQQVPRPLRHVTV